MRAATRRRLLPLALLGATLSAFSGSLLAAEAGHSSVNMTRGVTEVSHRVYDLHMYTLWVCVAIGVVVFGVMFYSIFSHRKSKGAVAAHFHESTTLEIAWTVLPFLILATLAAPATKTLLSIYSADEADLDVMITGYQWKWKYEYLDKGVSFFSALSTSPNEFNNINNPDQAPKGEHYLLEVDEPLVIPVDTKVRFLLTANDVIHSWWVPQLAVKRTRFPALSTRRGPSVSELGVYRGQCAELCGKDHGFMPIVVNVVARKTIRRLAEQAQAAEADADQGADGTDLHHGRVDGAWRERVRHAAAWPATAPNGEGGRSVQAISRQHDCHRPVAGHLDIGVNGVPGTAMQAFGAQLNDVDHGGSDHLPAQRVRQQHGRHGAAHRRRTITRKANNARSQHHGRIITTAPPRA